jgi:hypothetical protein
MKTKLGNIMYFTKMTRCLPTQFAPFPSFCEFTCCVTEYCVQLSSVLLRDRSSNVQAAFRNRSHTVAPSNSVIQKMVRNLETTGALQTQHGEGRPAVTGNTVQEMRQRILASPAKSLRRLSQETSMSHSS